MVIIPCTFAHCASLLLNCLLDLLHKHMQRRRQREERLPISPEKKLNASFWIFQKWTWMQIGSQRRIHFKHVGPSWGTPPLCADHSMSPVYNFNPKTKRREYLNVDHKNANESIFNITDPGYIFGVYVAILLAIFTNWILNQSMEEFISTLNHNEKNHYLHFDNQKVETCSTSNNYNSKTLRNVLIVNKTSHDFFLQWIFEYFIHMFVTTLTFYSNSHCRSFMCSRTFTVFHYT